MSTEPNFHESLEEIVFSTRNKEDGAYYLRKKHLKYTLVSLIIAILTISGAIVYPVVAAYLGTGSYIGTEVEIVTDILDTPEPDKPPDLPPPDAPPPVEQPAAFRAPVVIEDDSVESTLGVAEDINAMNLNAAPPTDAPLEVTPEAPVRVIEEPVIEAPVPWVPEPPEYPGGEESRIRFIKENLIYPRDAYEIGISGRVFITFVVEKDGAITGVKLIRGIGGGCDEEAIRVVKMMPKWKPGKNNGYPVRVQFNMDIKFTIAG